MIDFLWIVCVMVAHMLQAASSLLLWPRCYGFVECVAQSWQAVFFNGTVAYVPDKRALMQDVSSC